ncbi:MAG: DbpA RNA binding domain-containing protein [Spirochaetales bacterium]|nr:DbpA RNA binding domain-containing protein [Spirochaetales bacterium]
MINNKEEFSKLNENLEPSIKNILESITSEADLDSIVIYKKIFKKNVPLHMRSYLSAFLLREYLGKTKKRVNIIKAGEKSLFINIGKNRRVYPSDLIQLISKSANIDKENIGNIKILDNYSFINISEEKADAVISVLDGSDYRGRKLTVNFAKKDI